MFNPEVSELKRKYNILREQYQKLQGTVKVLQATMDELQTNLGKAEKDRDKYKRAFDDIFTNNIGDEWERLPDEEKKNMSIDNKLSFFENEINSSKLYIRRKMTELMESTVEKNKQLENEVAMLKAQLTEKETQLKNASMTGGLPQNTVKGSLLGDDEAGIAGVAVASRHNTPAPKPTGVGAKKPKGKPALFDAIKGALGGDLNKNNNDNKPQTPHIEVKKEAPVPTPAPVPVTPVVPTPAPAPIPEPTPQPAPTPEPVKPVEPPVQKPAVQKPTTDENRPTTNFFQRFDKAGANVQEQYKRGLVGLNMLLDKTTYGREVLLVVGGTGYYTVEDIFKAGVEAGHWSESSTDEGRVRRAITALSTVGENGTPSFLVKGNSNEQSVGKGRQKICYIISQAGEAWYALTTWKDPLKSLSIVRAKEQKSVNHAELIQKMIKILNDAGYETYQEVSLPTKTTGEYSIADISANKDDYMNIRIECEMGNYDLPSYVFKFAKALEVSDRLLVGVPTIVVKDKIIDAVKELIREHFGGTDNFVRAGKFYRVFTLEELHRNPNLILPDNKGRR